MCGRAAVFVPNNKTKERILVIMRLKIRDMEFEYAGRPVLKGINMDFCASEIAAVCGPNGVGKSTFIKCINRLLKPRGIVSLENNDLSKMSMGNVARHIGYVPQRINNIFSVTVFEMVLMGRCPHIGWNSSKEDREKVISILKLMGLEDHALTDFNHLSGGQQQKVIISRALAQDPEILLLDEPTSSLDLKHQLEVMELLEDMVAEKNISVIMAVHDLNLASRYADKIILMKDGVIHSVGSSKEVLTQDVILSVYGVRAVVREESGRPFVIPIGNGKQ